MKALKKIVALSLALMMLFSVVPVSFAASEQTCPVIYIPGIASSALYTDVNDPSTLVDFSDTDVIVEAVRDNIAPALIVYAADKDVDKLAAVVCEQLNVIFDGWFNNADGTAKGNSGAILNYPSAASISKKSTLTFDWDWRGDPLEVAKELDSYINYVIENSDCDKVALSCHSLGSVVILSYLSLYGNGKVSGIVLDTPAFDGVNYIGELLTGNMTTDGDALVSAVNAIFGSTENGNIIESIMDVFTLAGIPDELSFMFNSVLDEIAPVLYRDTLVPLFARWLTIWSMVPSEDIDASMDYIFSEYLTDEDSMILKSKIADYNERVRADSHQTLVDFDENEKLAVISRYGFASLPLTDRWTELGDTVIETSNSSIGATTAVYGDYFDDSYLADKDAKYISPDKTVDASTCLFPEKTWFIKNLNHTDTKITRPLYNTFLFSEQELTCDNSELARFSIFNAEAGEIDADNSEPEKVVKKSPFEVLFGFLRALFEKLFSFFRK